jgi:cytochrome c oxidase cbb3-type subunit III
MSGQAKKWVFVALAVALGCDQLPGKPDLSDQPRRPQDVVDFGQLFKQNCSGCHGAAGKLGPAPPLNDPVFQAIVTEKELRRVIRDGRPGTPMTAFALAKGGTLTDTQIDRLVKGIQDSSSVPGWGPPSVGKDLPPYGVGDIGTGNVENGKKVFARACATCHGVNGEGGKKGAVVEPAYLALTSDQALRRIIITGRPDLGMPNYAGHAGGKLSSQEIQDVTAWLASKRVVTVSAK